MNIRETAQIMALVAVLFTSCSRTAQDNTNTVLSGIACTTALRGAVEALPETVKGARELLAALEGRGTPGFDVLVAVGKVATQVPSFREAADQYATCVETALEGADGG